MIIKGVKNIRKRLQEIYVENLENYYSRTYSIDKQQRSKPSMRPVYDTEPFEDVYYSKYCESCVVVGMGFGNSCTGACIGNEDRM